jgi:glycosyltransferase involved in cell wall biosynthesis
VRVLILHSRYLSGDASGENRVVEDEARLLREAGHQVETWSPSVKATSGPSLLKTAWEVVWSRAAAAGTEELLQHFRPQVVHCHNLFPSLSPVVLRVAGRMAPTVMTLHNYRLLCLPATLLRDDRICEDCVGRLPWPGVLHGCYRGSIPASAALAASLTLHRSLGTFEEVTLYLAVNRFVMDKHVQAGLSPSKIRVKPNFVWGMPSREGPGDYFLFLGRLAPEKGVATLLSVWKEAAGRLLVIGDGPEAGRLRAMAPAGVEFGGSVPSSEVPRILRRARALLVPSMWYEGEPRAVLEAFAAGVPVVVSQIGGLPALVEEGRSGLVVPPEDIDGWARAVERLGDDKEAKRMGGFALHAWQDRHSPEKGLHELEMAYDQAIRLWDGGHARSNGAGPA